jgi:hypothetical protein
MAYATRALASLGLTLSLSALFACSAAESKETTKTNEARLAPDDPSEAPPDEVPTVEAPPADPPPAEPPPAESPPPEPPPCGPYPDYMLLYGECVPSCGAAGGNTCLPTTMFETIRRSGWGPACSLESWDCAYCCQL